MHEELQGYDELIAKFQASPVTDWESIVSSRRGDLGTEFFGHLNSRVQALHVRDTRAPASNTAGGLLPLQQPAHVTHTHAGVQVLAHMFDAGG